MKREINFITPVYNTSHQLKELYDSLKEQTNKNWKWIILNDASIDDTLEIAKIIEKKDSRVTVHNNKKKKFALKSICDYLYNKHSDLDMGKIFAIINGNDLLCNENTVDIVLKEYSDNPALDVLWTSHTWDINSINLSKDLPANVNPYQYPWVSSHLKSFKLDVFRKISEKNFKDIDDNWFERGCDQAIYLPILHLAKERKFLDEICYLYRLNSRSAANENQRQIIEKQSKAVRYIRARGFVK